MCPLVALAALCTLRSADAAEPQLQRFQATEVHMAVSFAVVLYAPDQETANRAFDAAFARIAELDRAMNDYNEESELSRLSLASPTTEPVPISDDLLAVLVRSQQMSEASGGAFDVTIGPLSKLWRRAHRQRELPAGDRLAEARAAVGYRNLRLDEKARTAELLKPNMRLDLGGIAKGYATDEALKALAQLGITRAMVNASGDMAMGDSPPDEPGWKVGIAPLEVDGPPSRFLRLKNCGIATSGDAFQFVEIEGKRYSHIIDPRTGLGLTDQCSVTVVARDGTTADALASAVSVMGPEAGMRLVEETPGAAAAIVRAPEGKVETFASRRFDSLDQEP
jgi:thiamine biosynthesis lipoprotein